MKQPPLNLTALTQEIKEQEKRIAAYKAWLAGRSEEELAALCEQKDIPVRRKAFVTRIALILAKRDELGYFELCRQRSELEDLEAHRAGKGPEVYNRLEQLNCSVEFLEEYRYHLFCAGYWQYSLKSPQIAMSYYRSRQRYAPVTLLAGRTIAFYGRMKPGQGQGQRAEIQR